VVCAGHKSWGYSSTRDLSIPQIISHNKEELRGSLCEIVGHDG
jgi:hypothetical protein